MHIYDSVPVIRRADVVVTGGTISAVAAAASAARRGIRVFLATPWTYLGEDLAGTYRLWPDLWDDAVTGAGLRPAAVYGSIGADALASRLIRDTGTIREIDAGAGFLRPMHVKTVLEDALVENGVEFLFGAFPVGTLVSGDDRPAGVVLATRSGAFGVLAPVIIDATMFSSVARSAGAGFDLSPCAEHRFRRIVVGGEERGDPDFPAQPVRSVESHIVGRMTVEGAVLPVREYVLEIETGEGRFSAFAAAEQAARNVTWHPGIRESSDTLHWISPLTLSGGTGGKEIYPASAEALLDVAAGGENRDLSRFFGTSVPGVYVLGTAGAITEEAKMLFSHPGMACVIGDAVGRSVGMAAGKDAEMSTSAGGLRVNVCRADGFSEGKAPPTQALEGVAFGSQPIKLKGNRQIELYAAIDPAEFPILDEVQVLVAGGGTGGAPAGVASAGRGASTLICEYLWTLGGVGTAGLIASYYHGYRGGFTAEVDNGVASLGGTEPPYRDSPGRWDIRHKSEWYRREILGRGGSIWFGTFGYGALVRDNAVVGVLVAGPAGPGIVLCESVVDSTGSADIAAAAGAQCIEVATQDLAVQGTGLSPRDFGVDSKNTDYTFADDRDVEDVTSTFVVSRRKYRNRYDLSQMLDTRERRQIVGDLTITPLDIYNRRTYADTVVMCRSNFDSHGFTVHPVFILKPPDREDLDAWLPLRCLLPKGLERIVVTGLGISAHRDAMPVLRMQPDIQNQGYVAGTIAALSAATGMPIRELDIRRLQKELVDKEILPQAVPAHTDSLPVPAEKLEAAVAAVLDDYSGVPLLLDNPEEALPLLKAAYAGAGTEHAKQVYAHVLAVMGDPSGSATLIDLVYASEWDEGWDYKGMGQFGRSVSPLDGYIIALGNSGDPAAILPILEKARRLTGSHAFSHFRAVAVALEMLGDTRGIPVLAGLLQLPGVRGHAHTDIVREMEQIPESDTDNSTRNLSLRELYLARALYRLGDADGMGRRVLEEYAREHRGPYAYHATRVLRGS